MNDVISELRIRLQQAETESSCAALNRLRAKLRELMKGGHEADQRVSLVVQRSIETIVELTENVDDLKAEIERLRAEIKRLNDLLKACEERRATATDAGVETITVDVGPLEKPLGEMDVSELLNRIKELEALIAQLRKQLVDKDAAMNDLQNQLFNVTSDNKRLSADLDQMMVSYKAVMEEVKAMKEELKKRDAKVNPNSMFYTTAWFSMTERRLLLFCSSIFCAIGIRSPKRSPSFCDRSIGIEQTEE